MVMTLVSFLFVLVTVLLVAVLFSYSKIASLRRELASHEVNYVHHGMGNAYNPHRRFNKAVDERIEARNTIITKYYGYGGYGLFGKTHESVTYQELFLAILDHLGMQIVWEPGSMGKHVLKPKEDPEEQKEE